MRMHMCESHTLHTLDLVYDSVARECTCVWVGGSGDLLVRACKSCADGREGRNKGHPMMSEMMRNEGSGG